MNFLMRRQILREYGIQTYLSVNFSSPAELGGLDTSDPLVPEVRQWWAEIYLKKKEELKTLDVNVFLLENVRIREQLDSVDEKYRIASDDLEHTTEHYNHIKEEYEAR